MCPAESIQCEVLELTVAISLKVTYSDRDESVPHRVTLQQLFLLLHDFIEAYSLEIFKVLTREISFLR